MFGRESMFCHRACSLFGKQNRVARVCIATVLILGLSQQMSLGSVSLSWSELPQFPDSVGVAGPFVGVHNDALIVAGGANFQPPVWQAERMARRNICLSAIRRYLFVARSWNVTKTNRLGGSNY